MTTYYGPDWERRCKEAEAELKEAYAKLELTNESFLATEAERDRLRERLEEARDWIADDMMPGEGGSVKRRRLGWLTTIEMLLKLAAVMALLVLSHGTAA